MNRRTFSRAAATGLLGLTLAGGGVALAQTSTAPAPAASAPVSTGTAPLPPRGANGANGVGGTNGAPSGMMPMGGGPGRGQGGYGPANGMGPGNGGMRPGDGGGMGPGAITPTTASVTKEISNFDTQLTSVKADRDYANGKMDLAVVNGLIDRTSALRSAAQSALTANNLTQAGSDIRAAESALRGADDLIIASLGTTGLPSAANRPARPTAPTGSAAPAAPTADQQKARTSNELARTYQSIVSTSNNVKANSSVANDPTFYTTTAQALYKQAYDLYNAGKYDAASQTARAAGTVAHTADDLLRAAGVAQAGPQAVPVPAPNF